MEERKRVILHSDLNNFFASVEIARNPALAGKPLIVCGDPKERHGIVLAKNYIAKKYGVQDRISFFLSDGVQNVPRDFDSLICAGMGADTMISILEAAPWLQQEHYRLILQCQSKTPMLRKYLSDHGWFVHRETVLRDGRFLYTIMEVFYCPLAPRLTLGQQYITPALRMERPELMEEYCQDVLFRLRRAINGRGEQADPDMVAALKELEENKW